MRYYYALWIPSYEIEAPRIIERELDETRLRDHDEYIGVSVKGRIDDQFRIDISYHLSDDATERHLYLNKVHHTLTGFLVYSIELSDDTANDNFFVAELRREMPTALYHFIKGFFHTHVNHASDADSKLKAYSVQAENFNFDAHKGVILDRVLGCYEDLFSGQVTIVQSQLSDALKFLSEDVNKFRNLDILDKLAVTTNNVLAEVSYCEFLLTQHEEDAATHDICIRIKQAIKTLKDNQKQLVFWNSHFHTRFSYADGVAGVRWGVGGFIIGCLSILLSIILPFLSHSEKRIINEVENNSMEVKALRDSLIKWNQTPAKKEIKPISRHNRVNNTKL